MGGSLGEERCKEMKYQRVRRIIFITILIMEGHVKMSDRYLL